MELAGRGEDSRLTLLVRNPGRGRCAMRRVGHNARVRLRTLHMTRTALQSMPLVFFPPVARAHGSAPFFAAGRIAARGALKVQPLLQSCLPPPQSCTSWSLAGDITPRAWFFAESGNTGCSDVQLSSVKKKRRMKMNKHKRRKRRKLNRLKKRFQ